MTSSFSGSHPVACATLFCFLLKVSTVHAADKANISRIAIALQARQHFMKVPTAVNFRQFLSSVREEATSHVRQMPQVYRSPGQNIDCPSQNISYLLSANHKSGSLLLVQFAKYLLSFLDMCNLCHF